MQGPFYLRVSPGVDWSGFAPSVLSAARRRSELHTYNEKYRHLESLFPVTIKLLYILHCKSKAGESQVMICMGRNKNRRVTAPVKGGRRKLHTREGTANPVSHQPIFEIPALVHLHGTYNPINQCTERQEQQYEGEKNRKGDENNPNQNC